MKKLAALSVILLSACHTTWGPHNLTLISIEGVTLTSRKGEVVDFQSETETPMTASYVSSKKTLTLRGDRLPDRKYDFDFKNVTFDKNDDALIGNQTDTGQNLAISIKRSFNGENVRENQYFRSCTYYESRPREHCYPTHHGGYHCSTTWEQYPVHGEQEVRETTVVRSYLISGALSQSIGTLAQLSGSYNDVSTSYTPLTICR